MAARYGIRYSRPGNGICHAVHYQRFARPGKTLLGSDSHTPTSGALGMLAMGAGGLSVALAMAGKPFYLKTPTVVNVVLRNKLKPGVAAKDIILEVLKRMGVKGGLGKVLEYSGSGVESLSVPERATIANMGAEIGATTSLFPSDEITRKFLAAQGREDQWIRLEADENARYDQSMVIDLSGLKPMVALPHMPDKVKLVNDVRDLKVSQVFVGSCTNASYSDLAKAARILEHRQVHPSVNLCVAPGSRQTYTMLARDGYLQKLIDAGARILECACGPCVGIGQAPQSGGVSLRTSNRNFKGRSGTADAQVYLVSPETAAVSAVLGCLSPPTTLLNEGELKELLDIKEPDSYVVDDRGVFGIQENLQSCRVVKGPNIKPIPLPPLPSGTIETQALLTLGDNITTDHIMPAGAKIMSLRSNVPAISEYVFNGVDPDFVGRAKNTENGIIVAGENYGQGSSREHAVIAPMFLGIRAVLAKSIARIHKDNLINYGLLPLIFKSPRDYDSIKQGDVLELQKVITGLKDKNISVLNKTSGGKYETLLEISDRQMEILIAGGELNEVKQLNDIL